MLDDLSKLRGEVVVRDEGQLQIIEFTNLCLGEPHVQETLGQS